MVRKGLILCCRLIFDVYDIASRVRSFHFHSCGNPPDSCFSVYDFSVFILKYVSEKPPAGICRVEELRPMKCADYWNKIVWKLRVLLQSVLNLTLLYVSFPTVHCASIRRDCRTQQYTMVHSVIFVLSYSTLYLTVQCLSYLKIHCTSFCSVCPILHAPHSTGPILSYSTLHHNQ